MVPREDLTLGENWGISWGIKSPPSEASPLRAAAEKDTDVERSRVL